MHVANGSRLARIGASMGALVLVAACAGAPERTASAGSGSAPTGTASTLTGGGSAPTPAAVERASGRVCRERPSTGRLLPKRVCTTPREDRLEDEASREQLRNAVSGAPLTGG